MKRVEEIAHTRTQTDKSRSNKYCTIHIIAIKKNDKISRISIAMTPQNLLITPVEYYVEEREKRSEKRSKSNFRRRKKKQNKKVCIVLDCILILFD